MNPEIPLLHVRHCVVSARRVLRARRGGVQARIGVVGPYLDDRLVGATEILSQRERIVAAHVIAFPSDIGSVEDRVPAPDRRLLPKQVCEAEPGSQVVPVGLDERGCRVRGVARDGIRPRPDELVSDRVEPRRVRRVVATAVPRCPFVPEAEIERQIPGDLVVILHVDMRHVLRHVRFRTGRAAGCLQRLDPAAGRGQPQQEARVGESGGACGVLRVGCGKAVVADVGEDAIVQDVADFHVRPDLQRVLARDLGERRDELIGSLRPGNERGQARSGKARHVQRDREIEVVSEGRR